MRGYYDGVAQQVVPVNFELKLPADPDFTRIDAFIRQVLDSEQGPADNPTETGAAQSDLPSRYASKVLRVASSLQRLGQIPIFAEGRLIEIREDPDHAGKYQVKALLPQLDYFPLAFLRNSLAAAVSLVRWASEYKADASPPHAAYNLIQNEIIRPMEQLVDSGVSTLPILRAAYQQGIPFWH